MTMAAATTCVSASTNLVPVCASASTSGMIEASVRATVVTTNVRRGRVARGTGIRKMPQQRIDQFRLLVGAHLPRALRVAVLGRFDFRIEREVGGLVHAVPDEGPRRDSP